MARSQTTTKLFHFKTLEAAKQRKKELEIQYFMEQDILTENDLDSKISDCYGCVFDHVYGDDGYMDMEPLSITIKKVECEE